MESQLKPGLQRQRNYGGVGVERAGVHVGYIFVPASLAYFLLCPQPIEPAIMYKNVRNRNDMILMKNMHTKDYKKSYFL